MSFTLEGTVRIKSVLEAVRENDSNDQIVRDLQQSIPSELHMEFYELLLPFLLCVRKESMRLSAEKYPTICDVIPSIFEIKTRLCQVMVLHTLKL